jgi:hypothetical protein
VAGAVGSAALGSHHGASLEDRGPLRAIAGRSTACPSRASLRAPISRPMAAPAQTRFTDLMLHPLKNPDRGNQVFKYALFEAAFFS